MSNEIFFAQKIRFIGGFLFFLASAGTSVAQNLYIGNACAGNPVSISAQSYCSFAKVNSPYDWEFTPQPDQLQFQANTDPITQQTVYDYTIAYATWNNPGSVNVAVYNIYCDGTWSNGTNKSFQVSTATAPTLNFSATSQICQNAGITFTASTNMGGTVNYYIDNFIAYSGPPGTHTISTQSYNLSPGVHSTHGVFTPSDPCASPSYKISDPLALTVTSFETLDIHIVPSQSVVCESNMTFQMKAEGTSLGNLSYAWYVNDHALADENNIQLRTQSVTIDPRNYMSGSVFSCTVNSDYVCGGSFVEPSFTLIKTANPVPPVVHVGLVETSICPGNPISFFVTGDPAGSNISWKLNSNLVASGPNVTLTTALTGDNFFTPTSMLQVIVLPPTPPNGCPYPYASGDAVSGEAIEFKTLPNPAGGPTTFRRCGGGSITLAPASYGNNLKWYFPDGSTQITTSAGLPINLESGSVQYQVATYSAFTSCESATKATITAIVNIPPDTPSPTGSNSHFGPGHVTLQAQPHTWGHEIHWYGLAPGVLTGLEQVTPFISSNTVYHIASYDPISTCESTQVPITAIIFPSGGNWIKDYTITIPGITDSTAVGALPVSQMNKATTYFDGLGRPVQSVIKQSSPSLRDVVTPVVYDEFGRESIQYLPYVSIENTGGYKDVTVDNNGSYVNSPQYKFYNDGTSVAIARDAAPYVQTLFEPSPLNRIARHGASGQAWQPSLTNGADKAVHKAYKINDEVNKVLLFSYDASTSSVSLPPDPNLKWYASNQLSAIITTDEHGFDIVEFMDKDGRVICKKVQYGANSGGKLYASTYYLYDDFGNLVAVLPPEALKQIGEK